MGLRCLHGLILKKKKTKFVLRTMCQI